MAELMDIRPRSPAYQTVEFGTNVIVSHDGTEHRVSTRKLPVQRLAFDYRLMSDEDIARVRAILFSRPEKDYRVPLWWESVTLSQDESAASTVLEGDFTYSDLQNGDLVLVTTQDGSTKEEATVSSRADGALTLQSGLANGYSRGSRVVPLVDTLLKKNASYARYRVNVAEARLEFRVKRQRALGGQGAPAINKYLGGTILDRRHLNKGLVEETFQGEAERIDYGRAAKHFQRLQDSKIRTKRVFFAQGRAELQWWKSFLDTVVGRLEPFYAPTWRPDLFLAQQPGSGAASILVKDVNNYASYYNFSDAHENLQLETDTGVLRRNITGYTDNGDGTVTLDLEPPLPVSFDPIKTVSLIEASRLGADTVKFEHRHNGESIVSLQCLSLAGSKVDLELPPAPLLNADWSTPARQQFPATAAELDSLLGG